METSSARAHARPRMFGTAAVAVAALALSGCGLIGGSAGLSFDPVPDEDATLTVWSFVPESMDNGDDAYAAILDAFTEEYPQVKVDLETIAYDDYFDRLTGAMEAESGPDVITMVGGAQAYGYRDVLSPLQDAIDPDIAGELRFVDESFSQDGNLYILPTGAYGRALLVNQDLLTDAGLDPASALDSWDGLLEACGTLAEAKIRPFASAWADGLQLEALLMMISSQIMDEEGLATWTSGELTFDDPVFHQAIDRVLQLNEAGCFGGEKALEASMRDDAFEQYYTGKAAILISGGLKTAEYGAEANSGTSVMPLPQVPESTHDAIIDAGPEAGWAVTTWTEHPEASVALVNFLASPEAQTILWEQSKVVPNLASFEIEPETPMQEAYLPFIVQEANHSGFASFSPELLSAVNSNAVALIGGTMTAEEFFAAGVDVGAPAPSPE